LGYSVVVVDLLLLFFTLSELQNASAVKIIADNFVFKKKKKKMSVDILVKTYQIPGLRQYTARIAFVKFFSTSL
jgi:purine-cytosine permease-like protein